MRFLQSIRKALIRWLIGKSTVIANADISIRDNVLTVTRANGIVYGCTFRGGQLVIDCPGYDVIDCIFKRAI